MFKPDTVPVRLNLRVGRVGWHSLDFEKKMLNQSQKNPEQEEIT